MELQGILGRGGYFWKIRGTNRRDRRIATLSTVTQAVLHIMKANPQCSSLGFQLLIVSSERVVVLSQLVNVESMVI